MAQQKRTFLKRLTLASLLLFGIYIIWCTIVWNRMPTILVDYILIGNEKALSVPKEDAALPLYLDAAIAEKNDPEPGMYEIQDYSWPYHAGWEIYPDWLHRHSETLELIREAGRKPGMGIVLGAEPTEKDRALWGDDVEYIFSSSIDSAEELPSKFDKLMEGSVLNVLLPYLTTCMTLNHMLEYDAELAAFEGDQSRFVSDIEAMLELANHTRENEGVIRDLVAIAMAHLATMVTGETLALSPEVFDDEHLLLLADLHRGTDNIYHTRIEADRVTFLDTLQRVYTDNGDGDGSFIVNSLPVMEFITSMTGESIPSIHPVLAFLSGPIVSLNVASRQEALAEYDRRLNYSIEQSKLPLYAREFDSIVPIAADNVWTRTQFILVDVLSGESNNPINQDLYSLARRDALVAAIAMELYRRKEGKWPTQLDQAMEEPSIDPWTGKPMLIAFDDGRPLIYSIGIDRNDDGGVLCKKEGLTFRSPWASYLEPEVLFEYSGNETEANGLARDWQPADADDLPDGDWILWPPIND